MQKETHNLQYAGIWRRWIAVTIDMLIFIVPKMLIALIFLTVFDWIGKDNIPYSFNYAAEICIFGLLVFVYAKFLSSRWQATPGKRIMSVYVVDKDRKPISLKRALIRVALPFLIFMPLSLIQPLGTSDTSYLYNESGDKYIPQFIETMPKITSEIRALRVEPATLTRQELMVKITSRPNLEKIYVEEFASLNEQQKREMVSAGYELNLFKYSEAANIGGIFLSFICSLVFVVWHLPAAFTRQKVTMHDMIAGTRAIYGRA